jgi:DNA replication protein DnaC
METHFKGEEVLLKKYYEITKDLSLFYRSGSAVCFAGTHGVGKTMTTTCILKKAAQKNFLCLYTTLSDIVSALTLGSNEDKFSARKELMVIDYLAIDEFDPRFMPSESAADLFGRSLENVFRARSQNKLPTIMCTNSPNVVESFSGPIRQSIESLMKGYVKIVPVIGTDFRKIKKSV